MQKNKNIKRGNRMNKLYNLCLSFRKAIERAYVKNEFIKLQPFNKFPNDCCDIACELLAQYLKENGIETIQINGTNIHDPLWHHVWLTTNNGIVIDITSDQFVGTLLESFESTSVHIGDEGKVHRIFSYNKIIEGHTEFLDTNKYDGLNGIPNFRQKTLSQLYSIILKYL